MRLKNRDRGNEQYTASAVATAVISDNELGVSPPRQLSANGGHRLGTLSSTVVLSRSPLLLAHSLTRALSHSYSYSPRSVGRAHGHAPATRHGGSDGSNTSGLVPFRAFRAKPRIERARHATVPRSFESRSGPDQELTFMILIL